MQLSEFIEATSRLETYYNKDYTNEQRQIMYEELKDLDISRYKKLISIVLKNSKFLPKIADILDAHKEEPYTTTKQETTKVECKKCNSIGYILYSKKIENGTNSLYNEYAAICECGNKNVYDGRKVTDTRYRTDFYTPTVGELGLEVL